MWERASRYPLIYIYMYTYIYSFSYIIRYLVITLPNARDGYMSQKRTRTSPPVESMEIFRKCRVYAVRSTSCDIPSLTDISNLFSRFGFGSVMTRYRMIHEKEYIYTYIYMYIKGYLVARSHINPNSRILCSTGPI